MVAWLVELLEFGLKYEPRGPMKAQCLADFVVELSTKLSSAESYWNLYVDGSSNTKSSGAGVILEGPDGLIIEQSLRFDFKTSNN